jgi:Domain of unknown function (DUF4173)
MSRDSRTALALTALAAALGMLGDALFHGRPLGLNVLLFALAFVSALALLLRVGRAPLHQGRRWLAAPMLVFAAAFLWHDSPLLIAANLVAIAGAVSLGALRRTQPSPASAGVGDYAAALASAGAGTVAGAVHLLHREVPWEEVERMLRGRRAVSVGRGLALGVPLLALFGGLFIAADAVFKNLVTSAVPDLSRVWPHVFFAAALGWAAAGLLRDLVAARDDRRVLPADSLLSRRLSLGATEVAVALGALVLLFAAFVTVQARYLFGGSALVQARAHLTYAEYARHGFFELVAVSLLVLPVILAANAVVRDRVQLVRRLSAVLVALELVVAASALQRLRLYQEQFGLTELRLYATGVVIWLAFVFLWLAVTTLRGRRHFAVGALVLGFAATAALNVVDPDALIARTNLSRPRIDVAYVGGLSDDAVPALLTRLPSLRQPLRGELARLLLARGPEQHGILGWNHSRAKAQTLLAERRPVLLRLAGFAR